MVLSTILATVLPALFPVVIDGAKMIFSKITGISMGEPKNFQERIELYKADTERLKAIGDLDRPAGDISRWVSDLRASFRYIAVGLIILATLIYCFFPPSYQSADVLSFLSQLTGSATFFIIGDRVYFHIKSGK